MSEILQNRLDQQKFGSIVVTNVWLLIAPFFIAAFVLQHILMSGPDMLMSGAAQAQTTVFGLPLVAIGVAPVGVICFGPLAVGVISVGGIGVISFGGIGIVSFGGVALGGIALGGGACGLIAVGGAALGYVAVGGGARGVYVLAGAGKGRYVFDRRRQDPKAVEFFCKYVPRLRKAFTA
jgi:hypothetical protein